jgi:hypothetical protein
VAQTLFEIGSKSFDWAGLIPALGFFLLGLSLVWIQTRKIGKFAVRKIGYGLCVSGLVFALYGVASWELRAHNALRALKTRQYSIVEGPIHSFHPMPFEGHTEERFVVQNEGFSYSDYVVTPCFNNTSSHGGL